MSSIPRSEYPRPQFVREAWRNLNGPWTYEFDFGKSGQDREVEKSTGFADTIQVPFCPESRLSGVEHKDFIPQMYYHRKLQIPPEWAGRNVLLHFGGVDYVCEAYVNGVSAGIHYGGMCSFAFDITSLVEAGGEYDLVVRARDEQSGGLQCCGKQSKQFFSAKCSYSRTTGIWQTVWMEAVHPQGLRSCRITPSLDAKEFVFRPEFLSAGRGMRLRTTISGAGVPSVTRTVPAVTGIGFAVELGETVRPWSPEDPFLYDILFEVLDASGNVIDTVRSYGGLRKIHVEKDRIYLNNKLDRSPLPPGCQEAGRITASGGGVGLHAGKRDWLCGPALLQRRVGRIPVHTGGPSGVCEELLGLPRIEDSKRRRTLRKDPGAGGIDECRSRTFRLVLHPVDGRGTGAERHLQLRPHCQGRPRHVSGGLHQRTGEAEGIEYRLQTPRPRSGRLRTGGLCAFQREEASSRGMKNPLSRIFPPL